MLLVQMIDGKIKKASLLCLPPNILQTHRREMNNKKDYVGAFGLIVCGIAFMCLFYLTISLFITYPGQN